MSISRVYSVVYLIAELAVTRRPTSRFYPKNACGDLNNFVDFRPWVMEGSPCEGEEAAKDPAAKQPPLGEACQPLVIFVIHNIGRS